jgi:membrane protease YdiL (CAAX protease family)
VRWYELVLLLLVAAGSFLFSFIADLLYNHPLIAQDSVVQGQVGANLRESNTLLSRLVALGVLAYVLHRGRRSFCDIGLVWDPKAASWGLPLFVLTFHVMTHLTTPLIYWLGQALDGPGWTPPDVSQMLFRSAELPLMGVIDSALNGFHEELIVRAYVMTEVLRLTGRMWLAVLVSVVIQTSYHFYQGVPMAVDLIPIFGVFALVYAKTRCVLPIAMAHSLSNLSSALNYGLR